MRSEIFGGNKIKCVSFAAQVTELEPQPITGTQCICSQKGRPQSWFRHHPKVHEHHVMLDVPTQSIATTPLLVQPPCPLSYLSNNHPIIFGEYVSTELVVISSNDTTRYH